MTSYILDVDWLFRFNYLPELMCIKSKQIKAHNTKFVYLLLN